MPSSESIKITNASEHNLRSVSLEFPKNKLIVVTGVSGSGKSSLIFDVLYREAESRYLGSFSSFARQFMGKLKKPAVEKVDGLSPAIALDQKSVVSNPRSTVGTITGIYDSLRLLFARIGHLPDKGVPFPLNRSLFSFNSPEGACPGCKGIGVEDFLDPELLIADQNRTLRQGALKITAPNGYIIYSQVTLDVLDQVCRSEGFHIDIPWKDLTPEQKNIVLYGSDKIEIPYGKHPLESRMKWSGITAKPRELGFYKGILPVMEVILQRDRNKNILRFVRSGQCKACGGRRLNDKALSVKIPGESTIVHEIRHADENTVHGFDGTIHADEKTIQAYEDTIHEEEGTIPEYEGTILPLNKKEPTFLKSYNIAELAALQLDDLQSVLRGIHFEKPDQMIAGPIVTQISKQVDLLKRLGLCYLTTDRDSTTLSGGESQRLRMATQAGTGLSGLICIFDEPSVGLHQHDIKNLIDILKEIRDKGNTVIVVEHEEEFMHHADWLIDIGPGPGTNGGEVLFNGTLEMARTLSDTEIRKSRTFSFLFGFEKFEGGIPRSGPIPMDCNGKRVLPEAGFITIEGASARNLRNIDVTFMLQALNVVTGVSGAGKSTLTNHILGAFLNNKLHDANEDVGKHLEIKGWERIGKLISIDQAPIGRTPRSNPATYTGLFDYIRDLYARLPLAISRGYDKSRFSFNTAGGRCESCQGAGYQQVGMHFMGNVEVLCEACEGRRFDDETLEITCSGYGGYISSPPELTQNNHFDAGVTPKPGKNISEVLEMTVAEALSFFSDEPKIARYLGTLDSLGLGYLTLGQRSSTLSGGEAQRIKLATELAKPQSDHTLYIMDEPTTGLHQADTGILLKALDRLIKQGHTVILIEHHLGLIAAADHIIDLGPGSGRDGGRLIFSGSPEEMINCKDSFTAEALNEYRILNNEYRISKFFSNENQGVSTILSQGNSFDVRHSTFDIQPSISLKGISTNNLKHIDAIIPHNKITVITGVSGSGKSSLAFDTIFAEGQNRFLESFSPYVRSRIGLKEKADFENISGLTPTFAVDQGGTSRNSRSTVGTMTGIYDHYRLLFSRIGRKEEGKESRISNIEYRMSKSDPDQQNGKIVNRKSYIVNPPPSSSLFSFNHKHGACPDCDGLGLLTVCDPEKLITHPGRSLVDGAMDGTKTGKFYGDPYGQYVATLKEVGVQHGIDFNHTWDLLSREAKEIALYGTGEEMYQVTWEFKRDGRIGEHHFTGPWKGMVTLVNEEYSRKHADHRGESMISLMKSGPCLSCSGTRLRKDALEYVVQGKNIAEVSALSVSASVTFFKSLLPQLSNSMEVESAKPLIGEILRKLEFLSGLGLSYITIDRISSTLSGGESQRIRLAGQLGSGLTGITYVLDEPTIGLHPRDTAKLMKLIRSLQEKGNTVVIVEHDRDVILSADYILDIGPGAGKTGGTVVAAGTPSEIMNNPASVTGPYLLEQSGILPLKTSSKALTGLSDDLSAQSRSLSLGTFSSGAMASDSLKSTRISRKSIGYCHRNLKPGLVIRNAFANNLKGFDLEIPSTGIIAITGVSGSGKSTLLFEVILASWENNRPVGCSGIDGFEHFQQIISVHQRTGFNSSLATPATYTGVFDHIRDLFAALSDAKQSGVGKSAFSYLNKEGRCATCAGAGQIRISMDFLSDVNTPCEQCQGKRYNSEILSFRYQEHNIATVLEMTVAEAALFFNGHKNISHKLQMLDKVGLGYLRIGQSLETLSGGESQRLALAAELMNPGKGSALYLFEEPSTGLHFRDIEFLMTLFHQLADQGNTLLVIEHDPMIIAHADHVIELGPDGGDQGGYLVNVSSP